MGPVTHLKLMGSALATTVAAPRSTKVPLLPVPPPADHTSGVFPGRTSTTSNCTVAVFFQSEGHTVHKKCLRQLKSKTNYKIIIYTGLLRNQRLFTMPPAIII